jgi:hypothetical protein
MLSFIKKLFGIAPATTAEAPYKVEAPIIVLGGEPIATVIVEGAGVVEIVEAKPTAKKATKAPAAPAVKKPRAKKAPKA